MAYLGAQCKMSNSVRIGLLLKQTEASPDLENERRIAFHKQRVFSFILSYHSVKKKRIKFPGENNKESVLYGVSAFKRLPSCANSN